MGGAHRLTGQDNVQFGLGRKSGAGMISLDDVPKGMYLYGDVGTGKVSRLVQLCLSSTEPNPLPRPCSWISPTTPSHHISTSCGGVSISTPLCSTSSVEYTQSRWECPLVLPLLHPPPRRAPTAVAGPSLPGPTRTNRAVPIAMSAWTSLRAGGSLNGSRALGPSPWETRTQSTRSQGSSLKRGGYCVSTSFRSPISLLQ